MTIGFDVISDLNLTKDDEFNWEGKATSLFCVIPGNISNDIDVVFKTLKHLSTMYQGVFFIDGSAEYSTLENHEQQVKAFRKLCKPLKNVVYLHDHVVILEGVAIVGVNGWYGNHKSETTFDMLWLDSYRCDDLSYLIKTIDRLQLHVDVKRIMLLSNGYPMKELYYGDDVIPSPLGPAYALAQDTEEKVKVWVYGTCDKTMDTEINGVRYVNNSCHGRNPYWAKRIEI